MTAPVSRAARLYAIRDVAQTFADARSRPVEVQVTPRNMWVEPYRKLGFSEAAALSYASMTGATLDGTAMPKNPIRGSVTLQQYINRLVEIATDGGR